jgi:hypothetical protein
MISALHHTTRIGPLVVHWMVAHGKVDAVAKKCRMSQHLRMSSDVWILGWAEIPGHHAFESTREHLMTHSKEKASQKVLAQVVLTTVTAGALLQNHQQQSLTQIQKQEYR